MDTPPEAVEPTPGGSDGAAVPASGALSAGGGGGGELTSLPSPAMPAAPPAPPSLPFPRRISTLPPSPATRPTVILNVYNLTVPSPPPSLLAFTSMLASTGLGLHHSGVQVGTTEYAFGGHNDEGTGVFEVRPRAAPGAEFRESIPLGDCVYSATEVREIVRAMGVAWPGAGYNLLTRNCNHFADQLCRRLTGVGSPPWVNRLAGVGAAFKWALPEGFDTPMAAPVVPDEMRPERDAARDGAVGRHSYEGS